MFPGYQLIGQNVTYGRRDWHEAIDFIRELPANHRLRSPDAAREGPMAEPVCSAANKIPAWFCLLVEGASSVAFPARRM
jgi:hypothetical protein